MKTLFYFLAVFLTTLMVGVSLEISPIGAVIVSFALSVGMSVLATEMDMHTTALACGLISDDIKFDCDNPLQAGVRARLILLNLDDIDTVDLNATNKLLLEDLTLKATKVGYEITGRENTITALAELIPAQELFNHTVTAMGFNISAATKLNIQGMVSGRFVAIVENVNRGLNGETAFEVFGLDAGLKLNVLTRNNNDVESQGAFAFTFVNSDTSKEKFLPRTFYEGTSYATTKALVDALLVP